MKEWTIYITYGIKPYQIKAALEYHSEQIMRIRVHGKSSSLLLENNYPAVSKTKNTRGIKWKIREGAMKEGNKDTSRLLMDIMQQLEVNIKKDFPPNRLMF